MLRKCNENGKFIEQSNCVQFTACFYLAQRVRLGSGVHCESPRPRHVSAGVCHCACLRAVLICKMRHFQHACSQEYWCFMDKIGLRLWTRETLELTWGTKHKWGGKRVTRAWKFLKCPCDYSMNLILGFVPPLTSKTNTNKKQKQTANNKHIWTRKQKTRKMQSSLLVLFSVVVAVFGRLNSDSLCPTCTEIQIMNQLSAMEAWEDKDLNSTLTYNIFFCQTVQHSFAACRKTQNDICNTKEDVPCKMANNETGMRKPIG